MSFFSSYVQQYNSKQLIQFILCQSDARRLAGGKGHETACCNISLNLCCPGLNVLPQLDKQSSYDLALP